MNGCNEASEGSNERSCIKDTGAFRTRLGEIAKIITNLRSSSKSNAFVTLSVMSVGVTNALVWEDICRTNTSETFLPALRRTQKERNISIKITMLQMNHCA